MRDEDVLPPHVSLHDRPLQDSVQCSVSDGSRFSLSEEVTVCSFDVFLQISKGLAFRGNLEDTGTLSKTEVLGNAAMRKLLRSIQLSKVMFREISFPYLLAGFP